MTVSENGQAGMFDKTVEDPELAVACRQLLDNEAEHRAWLAAKKTIKSKIAEYGLPEAGRLRCDGFVLYGQGHSGGGFEVPEWESVGAKVVEA